MCPGTSAAFGHGVRTLCMYIHVLGLLQPLDPQSTYPVPDLEIASEKQDNTDLSCIRLIDSVTGAYRHGTGPDRNMDPAKGRRTDDVGGRKKIRLNKICDEIQEINRLAMSSLSL